MSTRCHTVGDLRAALATLPDAAMLALDLAIASFQTVTVSIDEDHRPEERAVRIHLDPDDVEAEEIRTLLVQWEETYGLGDTKS